MTEMKQKKGRAPNFSKEDKDALVQIVLEKYKDIIESKTTDAITSMQKQHAWKNVAADFNSTNINRPNRSWQTLKLCYENIKKRTKKAFAHDKIELHKTGGGGFKKPTVDETGQKLIAALQAQFLPLGNPFDDDDNFHPEVMSELQSGNDVISVPTSAETSAISAQEEDHYILLEEIPVQEEVLGNICIEQAPASESADLHTALPSTSKTADVHTTSRAPKRKRKTDSVGLLEAKRSFYKRRLECLEAEHKIKMENFNLENEIKHLEILEKKRKLGLDNQ